MSVDLEAAEKLGKELSEIESEGFQYYSAEIMETIRDLVAEVRSMQQALARGADSRANLIEERDEARSNLAEARRQLASSKEEASRRLAKVESELADLNASYKTMGEYYEGLLTVAREALERIDKLKMECHELHSQCPVCIAETALIQIGGSDA